MTRTKCAGPWEPTTSELLLRRGRHGSAVLGRRVRAARAVRCRYGCRVRNATRIPTIAQGFNAACLASGAPRPCLPWLLRALLLEGMPRDRPCPRRGRDVCNAPTRAPVEPAGLVGPRPAARPEREVRAGRGVWPGKVAPAGSGGSGAAGGQPDGRRRRRSWRFRRSRQWWRRRNRRRRTVAVGLPIQRYDGTLDGIVRGGRHLQHQGRGRGQHVGFPESGPDERQHLDILRGRRHRVRPGGGRRDLRSVGADLPSAADDRKSCGLGPSGSTPRAIAAPGCPPPSPRPQVATVGSWQSLVDLVAGAGRHAIDECAPHRDETGRKDGRRSPLR